MGFSMTGSKSKQIKQSGALQTISWRLVVCFDISPSFQYIFHVDLPAAPG